MLSATWPVVSGNPKGLQFRVPEIFRWQWWTARPFWRRSPPGNDFVQTCDIMISTVHDKKKNVDEFEQTWNLIRFLHVFTIYLVLLREQIATGNGVFRESDSKRRSLGIPTSKLFESFILRSGSLFFWINHHEFIIFRWFSPEHTLESGHQKKTMSHETNPCYFPLYWLVNKDPYHGSS